MGSDYYIKGVKAQKQSFNPRSRVGSDRIAADFVRKMLLFQSTLPRGERHGEKRFLRDAHVFQSTLPRGERRN